MTTKKQKIDKSTRPPVQLQSQLYTDEFLMYLIQDTTSLSTSEILGFFADLSREAAIEAIHFMYEKRTNSTNRYIFDFFPNTSIPYSINIVGTKQDRRWSDSDNRYIETERGTRRGEYTANVGFPSQSSMINQSKLADIIMEKALLGACDMPKFTRPDPKCSKIYKNLMKEVRERRMI